MIGSGKGALLVPKQFAAEKGVREGGAIDHVHFFLRSRAVSVERLRGQLLSGAALAGDQDGQVGRPGLPMIS